MPLFYDGLPWSANFQWTLTNYTVLWFAGFGIVVGGWWVLSARKWFKGPVRMGTEEELEQLETKQEGEFMLPADTGYQAP